jgi:hypothetical protein
MANQRRKQQRGNGIAWIITLIVVVILMIAWRIMTY